MSMISYFAKFVKMLRSRLPWAVLRGPLGGRDPASNTLALDDLRLIENLIGVTRG